MCRGRLALLGIGLAAGSLANAANIHPPKPLALDALLAFASPGSCAPGPLLDPLRKSVLRDTTFRGHPVVGPLEMPARFKAAVGPIALHRITGGYRATLPMRGTWFGMPVTSLETRAYDGGDGGGFRIAFAANRDRVRAALNQAGFDIPEKGEREIVDPRGGESRAISLIRRGSTTELRCDVHD